jgi:hypothetical protein
MKTIKKSDNCQIIFGEWFDKINGNTYFDALIYVGDSKYTVPYTYGYNHGDKQAIDESLAKIGYRVRANKKDTWKPYHSIRTVCLNKLKRDLYTS